MLTDEQLDAIRARCETARQCRVSRSDDGLMLRDPDILVIETEHGPGVYATFNSYIATSTDVGFHANALDDMRALLAEVDRLRAKLAEVLELSEASSSDWRSNLARLTAPVKDWPPYLQIDLMRQSRQPVMDEFVRPGNEASGQAGTHRDDGAQPEPMSYEI